MSKLLNFQILGFSAGVPTQNRGVSSLIISTSNYDIMIDCGEGTYLRWKKMDYKWKNLKYIFITHMHPDHTGGLIPLLFYRKQHDIISPLTFIGPPILKKFITDVFKLCGLTNNPNYIWIDISKEKQLYIEDEIKVNSSDMKHKIPCWGYRIEDKSKSLVFITDTLYTSKAIYLAKNCDILIHEATFNHNLQNQAHKHFHTTNLEAMNIADKANVKKLILTHFSKRLSNNDLNQWKWNGKSCVIFDEKQKI